MLILKLCISILSISLVTGQTSNISEFSSEFIFYANETTKPVEILKINVFLAKLQQTVLITCSGYDSLANASQIKPINNSLVEDYSYLEVKFVDCFNNETNNGNYQNFTVRPLLVKLIGQIHFLRIGLVFNEYGVVNETVFFRDFNLLKIFSIELTGVNVVNPTKIMQNYLQSNRLILQNVNSVNFTDFPISKSILLIELHDTMIVEFTKENLAKFRQIESLYMTNFQIVDFNPFNVSKLFEGNPYLEELDLTNSFTQIDLHEEVFSGMNRLYVLKLNNLQLENIPPNLFQDLRQLQKLELKNNNINVLATNLFINNPNLFDLQFGNDEFVYAKEIEQLQVLNGTVATVAELNVESVSSLIFLLRNSKIAKIIFLSCNMSNISVVEFTQNFNRSTPLTINFKLTAMKVSSPQGAEIKSSNVSSGAKEPIARYDQLKTAILITNTDYDVKYLGCWYDQELQMMFLLNRSVGIFEMYLKDQHVLIMIEFKKDTNLMESYRTTYDQNCLSMCTCYHNLVLDDVSIDCTDRNLTAIPIIPYPSQFPVINTIDIDFSSNLLEAITFDNQSSRVLDKLSAIHFIANPVTKIQFLKNSSYLNNNISCDADFYVDKYNDSVVLSMIYRKANTTICGMGVLDAMDSTAYVNQTSIGELKRKINLISCPIQSLQTMAFATNYYEFVNKIVIIYNR